MSRTHSRASLLPTRADAHTWASISALLVTASVAGCGGSATLNSAATVGRGTNSTTEARTAHYHALSVGENHGRLSPDDPSDEDGVLYQLWRIELEPSRRVRIRMSSRSVDPVIELTGPNGLRLSNDDAVPGTLDAMLDFVPPTAGLYVLRTSTYRAAQTGEFTVTVESRDGTPSGREIQLGSRLDSDLSQNQEPGLPGSWMHFEGRGGSIVRLRVTSRDFDTIATLLGPGGETWVNDDAHDLGPNGEERGLDSTIVAALPTTGIYHLVVTPYGRGAGRFAVRSSLRDPVVMSGTRPPDGLAGENGGRVLGLYAGITEYQNASRLYGCADDARLLADAMRQGRLQSEGDQLVLPDALATRAAFLSGLAQLAARARPQDVVVIFFSGHGQQVAARGDNHHELDGMDETIVLMDGPLTDDEVVRAIEPIRAETIILALDACHSGGFADDFVRQPGRMGLFSSDEDVLSDTAEPHQAGGYLSWHLRRGVIGHADRSPRDGVLHAGELGDYLLGGFVDDHRLMNPERDHSPAQRLVVRRGSVTWDTVLWVHPRDEDLSLPSVPDAPLTSAPPR